MIKLIASDMDGTLLDAEGNVPSETFELISGLRRCGVHFVASSGRRFDTLSEQFGYSRQTVRQALSEQFAPVVDFMDFVASNGAQVVVGGKLVDREVFSHAAVCRLYRAVTMFDVLHLALFDRTNSFLLDDEAVFEREIDKNLPNPVRAYEVPSPEASIIKASVYVSDGTVMDMSYALTRELGEDFVFAPSGRKWIDVMQRGVNKATGIRQVMETHGVSADEVAAFGDSMNDYEIMRMVGTSIAMGNGRSAIKEISTKVIGPNTEHAVQRELEALLSMMGK